jgi:hypothetical protein
VLFAFFIFLIDMGCNVMQTTFLILAFSPTSLGFFQPPFISTPCFSRVYPITKSVTYHGKLPGEKEREREVAELLN